MFGCVFLFDYKKIERQTNFRGYLILRLDNYSPNSLNEVPANNSSLKVTTDEKRISSLFYSSFV